MLLGQLFAYGLNNFTSKSTLLKSESKKPLVLISSRAWSSVVVVLYAEDSPCKI